MKAILAMGAAAALTIFGSLAVASGPPPHVADVHQGPLPRSPSTRIQSASRAPMGWKSSTDSTGTKTSNRWIGWNSFGIRIQKRTDTDGTKTKVVTMARPRARSETTTLQAKTELSGGGRTTHESETKVTAKTASVRRQSSDRREVFDANGNRVGSTIVTLDDGVKGANLADGSPSSRTTEHVVTKIDGEQNGTRVTSTGTTTKAERYYTEQKALIIRGQASRAPMAVQKVEHE
jgi:hypothetical protein